MRKWKILLGLTLIVAIFAVCGVKVDAARGLGSACQSGGSVDDVHFFPWQFICGSNANTSPQQAILAGPGDIGISPNPPSSVANGAAGLTLDFSGGYSINGGDKVPKGYNKETTGNEVMVWATIDANDSIVALNDPNSYVRVMGTPANVDPGVADKCPGVGSGKWAPVYNFRDIEDPGPGYGPNQSPVAYDGSNLGKEDCGSQGKMVYWTGAKESTDYKFQIKTKPRTSGRICVRLNFSVRFQYSNSYRYNEPYFESSSPDWNNNTYVSQHDQHSVASHVVQQSTEQCYDAYVPATPPPPTGNCQFYQATGGLQPNSIYRFTLAPIDQEWISGGPVKSTRSGNEPFTTDHWQTYSALYSNPIPNYYYQTPSNSAGVIDTQTANQYDSPDNVYRFSGVNGGRAFTMTYPQPRGPDRKLYIEYWQKTFVNGAWNGGWTYHGGPASYTSERNCYSAQCQVSFTGGLVAGDPKGLIAGQQFTASFRITNTGKKTLVGSLSYNNSTATAPLSFTGTGSWGGKLADANAFLNAGPETGGNADNILVAGGQSVTFSTTLTAPTDINNYTLSGYPDYYGLFALGGTRSDGSSFGGTCTDGGGGPTIKTYKEFVLTPHAQSDFVNSDNENPDAVSYRAYLTNNMPFAVPSPAQSKAGINGGPNFGLNQTSGPYAPGDTNTIGPGTSPIGAVTAGDRYCARVEFNGADPYNYGKLGPGNVVQDTGLIDGTVKINGTNYNTAPFAEDCATVSNKPFFKVYGGSVSAGGNYLATGSCSGGGVLAGFYRNDSVDAAFKYGQGSGTDLAALGIGQITGFASAQKDATKSPIELTFANQGTAWPVQSDPKLGGLYGGDRCLDNAEPPVKTGAVTTTLPGGSTINATTIPVGENRSIFVNGDVYINGDITYAGATGGWTPDNVPSLVIKAVGGNIYIDNDVKNLDGLYIAEANGAATNKGQIYTCSSGIGAQVTQNNLYDNCYKQLTVHGNFVARKVNLMRTYGSLRDEKPTTGKKAVAAGPGVKGVSQRPIWAVGPNKPSGLSECVRFDVAGENGSTKWKATWLCLDNADAADIDIAFKSSNSGSDPLAQCEKFDFINNLGDKNGWKDVKACSNVRINAGTAYNLASAEASDGGLCVQMYNDSDGHIPYWKQSNNIKIFICLEKEVTGGGGSAEELPKPINNPLVCSNARPGGKSYFPAAGRPDTCAAEVFDYSPEFYLAQPSIIPPSGGAIIYDAITSLPPVL